MKIFGIFGDPIEHSLSPAMQNAAMQALGIKACYHAFRVTGEDLKDALLGGQSYGLSRTEPDHSTEGKGTGDGFLAA